MKTEVSPSSRRVLGLLLTASLAIAVVGFFTGTRTPPEPAGYRETHVPGAHDAPTAPRHRDMAEARYRERGEEQASALGLLAQPPRSLDDEVALEDAGYARAVERRREGRAYDGAPPTVPHAVAQQDAPSCLACHERGLRAKDKIATPLSHAAYTSCLQCHATRESPVVLRTPTFDEAASPSYENAFTGLASPGRGPRAYPGAPPQMPHKGFMRERCTSCHGVWADGLASSHANRQNCVQCHTPAATTEQLPRSTFARLGVEEEP